MEWYTLEKNNNGYTVWFNKEEHIKDKCGGCGSLGLYTGTKKECIEYCKVKGIKLTK